MSLADILDKATCTKAGIGGTTAGSCKVVTSCCATFSATTGGTAIADKLLCLPLGSVVATAVVTTDTIAGITSNNCFPVAACVAAPAGASTLAVSAAALATAVYMM